MSLNYLVASGPMGERVGERARIPGARSFARADAFLPLGAHEPGLVLIVPRTVPATDVVAVLDACAEAGAPWTPVLVEPRGEGFRAFPLHPDAGRALEAVAELAPSVQAGTLTLAELSSAVRATRHEINNPLGAALVEVQLLLMDVSDEEIRQALGRVQTQLRRIGQLLARLPAG